MISIVIPVRNDQEEANATIASIRATAGNEPEIVVIDDGSDKPLTLDHDDIVFRRVEGRCGVGGSRHLGSILSSRENILLLDSHCRFEPGWYEEACRRIKDYPQTIWTTTCVGLNAANMDIATSNKFYNGATLNLFGENHNKPEDMQFIEAKWVPGSFYKDGDEIACLLGGAYFMRRDFFFKIGGSKMLNQWGSSEPHLSLKAWLAGGDCRLMKTVRIGHQFRTATTYTSKRASLLFNKMMIAMTLFPEEAAEFIVRKLEQHTKPTSDLMIAKNLIKGEQRHIECDRAYNQAVFTRDLDWYLEKFKLPRFWLER
jgi:glycosyltransferase involved in cell wall biosynthesis